MEKLEELGSLQNQVKTVKLQGKLGKQNFHEVMKKVLEPVTDTIKNTSEDLSKTIILTSKETNKALENIKINLLDLLNGTRILASYLSFPLSKITFLENTTQFKLLNDFNSNRVNDLLIHNTIPVTLYDILLTFLDTNEQFDL